MTRDDHIDRLQRNSRRQGACLLWTGRLDPSGYGAYSSRFNTKPHRIAFTVWVGEIPEKYVVHHTCHIRSCIEPTHLEAVTEEYNSHPNQIQPPDGCYACGADEPVSRRGDNGRFCRYCWSRMPGQWKKVFPLDRAYWYVGLFGEAKAHLREIQQE